MDQWNKQGIIKQPSLYEMVDTFLNTMEFLETTRKSIEVALENFSIQFGSNYSQTMFRLEINRLFDHLPIALKQFAWGQLFEISRLKAILPSKDLETIRKGVYKDHTLLPEITQQTVFETFQEIVQNSTEYMRESIIEAFDLLTPGKINSKLKTNKIHAFAIGKKVILRGYVRQRWERNREGDGYNYYWDMNDQHYLNRTDELTTIDKVFHFLDDKRMPESQSCPLVTAIKSLDYVPIKTNVGNTEYFRFKCYENGNLHLEFKRMDLVAKVNRYGAEKYVLKGDLNA